MRCPICKSELPESDSPTSQKHFPFCSERCKLIDLGRWLSGKYQIPVRETDPDDAMPEISQQPPNED